MWSYGTAVLVFVQAGQSVPFSVMLTPLCCLACGVFVTARAFSVGGGSVPAGRDWLVLASDALIMLCYLACISGLVPSSPEDRANFVLLPAVSSVLSAWPTIRSTYRDPRRERPSPWLISALSDALVAATVIGEGLDWRYLAYPVVTMLTQLPVAVFALGWQGETRCAKSP